VRTKVLQCSRKSMPWAAIQSAASASDSKQGCAKKTWDLQVIVASGALPISVIPASRRAPQGSTGLRQVKDPADARCLALPRTSAANQQFTITTGETKPPVAAWQNNGPRWPSWGSLTARKLMQTPTAPVANLQHR